VSSELIGVWVGRKAGLAKISFVLQHISRAGATCSLASATRLSSMSLLFSSLLIFGETLPERERISGGLMQTGRDFRMLLCDRVFFGTVVITGLLNAAIFAYLGGATFVLQGIYGLSPQGYSLAFGLNSLGFMVIGCTAGGLSERWSQKGTLIVGLVMCVAGASGHDDTKTPQPETESLRMKRRTCSWGLPSAAAPIPIALEHIDPYLLDANDWTWAFVAIDPVGYNGN
jgi:hypothetical protein